MLPYRSENKNQYIKIWAQNGVGEEEERGKGQRRSPFSSPKQEKQDLDKAHNKGREKIGPNVKKLYGGEIDIT